MTLAAAVAASSASTAGAQGRRGPDGSLVEGYVVAESWFGKGSVRGLVRRGPAGLQVQLPGGNWIDCGRSCKQTLRQQTVDFWENTGGPQAKDGGPGYFHWEFRY